MELASRLLATVEEIRLQEELVFPQTESIPWLPSDRRHIQVAGLDSDFQHDRRYPGIIFSDLPIQEPTDEDIFGPNHSRGDAPTVIQADVLAWYRSFRYLDWGIFVRATGVEKVAHHLNKSLNNPALARALAFDFLKEHEYTHFRIDVTAASAEVPSQRNFWASWRQREAGKNGYSLKAEAFCNSHAFGRIPASSRSDMHSWLAKSPVGYRDYGNLSSSPNARLVQWSELWSEITGKPAEIIASYVPRNKALLSLVPLFLVDDVNQTTSTSGSTFFIGGLPVEESDDFWKALRKTGNSGVLAKKWMKAREQLTSGIRTPGLNLEPYGNGVWSIRLGQGPRVLLRLGVNGAWIAFDVSQQHDLINKKAAGL